MKRSVIDNRPEECTKLFLVMRAPLVKRVGATRKAVRALDQQTSVGEIDGPILVSFRRDTGLRTKTRTPPGHPMLAASLVRTKSAAAVAGAS
jgi:hypothetical protein